MLPLHGIASAAGGTLVHELLDAHADAADLAAGLRREPTWAAHLDDLRDLQPGRPRDARLHGAVA
ncbi:MAG TPA: hypothetical protein VFG42_20175 [Baekduia sp.]|nr:hypothetical protein [Baekduia sp.]